MKHAGILAATVLACAIGTAALAGPSYDCKITAHSRYGFVPARVLVFFEEDFSAAYVYDDFIHAYRKSALQADLAQTGATKYELSWILKGVETSIEKVTTQNMLRIDTGRMRATFTSYVNGYFNTNRGSGKCQPWKGKK